MTTVKSDGLLIPDLETNLPSASQFSLPVCIFVCMSPQSSLGKRKCVFRVTPKNYKKYATEGNVSDLVQYCKSSQCCVAYGAVVKGQPKVDVLGEKGEMLPVRDSSAPVFCRGQYVQVVQLFCVVVVI